MATQGVTYWKGHIELPKQLEIGAGKLFAILRPLFPALLPLHNQPFDLVTGLHHDIVHHAPHLRFGRQQLTVLSRLYLQVQ